MRIIILVLVATVVSSTKGEMSETVEDAQRSNRRPPAIWLSQLNTADRELRTASKKLQQYDLKNSDMGTTLAELSRSDVNRLTRIQEKLVGELKHTNVQSRSSRHKKIKGSRPKHNKGSKAARECIDSLIDEADNLVNNFKTDVEDCYSYSQKSAATSKISNAKSNLKDAQDLVSKAKDAYNSCECVLVLCHCALNAYEVTNAVTAANDAISAVDNIGDLFDDARIEHCIEKKMKKATSDAEDIKARSAECKQK